MTGLIPSDVAAKVKERIGDLYDSLLGVMMDLAVSPLLLLMDDRPRLVEVRDLAIDTIAQWHSSQPEVVDELVGRLPQFLRVDDAAVALLQATLWTESAYVDDRSFRLPHATDPVFAHSPDLLSRMDGDGLLAVAGLDARAHGLLHSELALHYHDFLRRGFAANVHYELISEILGMSRRRGVVARLAVDGHRFRYRSEYEEFEERDFWYGPPLDDAILDNPYLVGEAIHGDKDGGRSILNPYVATSFRWAVDGPLKTIEVEEMVPVVDDGPEVVHVRYLHAIRDTRTATFIHCDGAVKAYQASLYPREVADFRRRGRGDRYRKVFRVDGEIRTDDWSRLTAQWFRGNQLVLEYLSTLDIADPPA